MSKQSLARFLILPGGDKILVGSGEWNKLDHLAVVCAAIFLAACITNLVFVLRRQRTRGEACVELEKSIPRYEEVSTKENLLPVLLAYDQLEINSGQLSRPFVAPARSYDLYHSGDAIYAQGLSIANLDKDIQATVYAQGIMIEETKRSTQATAPELPAMRRMIHEHVDVYSGPVNGENAVLEEFPGRRGTRKVRVFNSVFLSPPVVLNETSQV